MSLLECPPDSACVMPDMVPLRLRGPPSGPLVDASDRALVCPLPPPGVDVDDVDMCENDGEV